MDSDKFENFQLQMDITIPPLKNSGGGQFKLMPNYNFDLDELWEYILFYKEIHKSDYIIWLYLDNVNKYIKVLVK